MSGITVYLDAVLEPPRALSPRGFAVVMLLVGGVSAVCSIVFLAMQAYPVAGFFGLDVLLVWLMFRANFRSQRLRTYIRITAETVELVETDAQGRTRRRAELPSLFTRVRVAERGQSVGPLCISASGRSYAFGSFLTGAERRSLVRRIDDALRAAKAERSTGDTTGVD
ncbi:DUF2244 domain-containing protein [bacterium]|nr:DUF2244 domain-containing protein [bacterium]